LLCAQCSITSSINRSHSLICQHGSCSAAECSSEV
jgi:hypothetical protein